MLRWNPHSYHLMTACKYTLKSGDVYSPHTANHMWPFSFSSSFCASVNQYANPKHDTRILACSMPFSGYLFSSIHQYRHSHEIPHLSIYLNQYRQKHSTEIQIEGTHASGRGRGRSRTAKETTDKVSSSVKKRRVDLHDEPKLENNDMEVDRPVGGSTERARVKNIDNNDTSSYPTTTFSLIPPVTPLTISGSPFIGSDVSALQMALKPPRCGSPIWLTADEVTMLQCGVKSDAIWVGLPSSARPGGLNGLQCFTSPVEMTNSTNLDKSLPALQEEMNEPQTQSSFSSSQAELSLLPLFLPTIFVVNAVDTFYPHLFYSGMCHEHRILVGYDGFPLGHIPCSSGTVAGTPAQPTTSSSASYQSTAHKQRSSQQTEENIPSLDRNTSDQSKEVLQYNSTQSSLSKASPPAALVATSAAQLKHVVGYTPIFTGIKGNINCNGDATVAAACAHLQQQIGFTSPYWIPTWFAKHCLGLEVLPGANLVACISSANGQVSGLQSSNSMVSNGGLFSLPGAGCDEIEGDMPLLKSACFPSYSCPSVERHLVSLGTGTKSLNSICNLPNTDMMFLVNAEQTSDASRVNSDTCFPYFPTVIGVSYFDHPTEQNTTTCRPQQSTIVHRIPLLLSLSHRKILSQVPGQTLPIFIDRRVIDILGLTLKPDAEGVSIDDFYQDQWKASSIPTPWKIDAAYREDISKYTEESRGINQGGNSANWAADYVENDTSSFSSTAILVNIAHIKEDAFIQFLATYYPSKVSGHPLSGVAFPSAFPTNISIDGTNCSDNGIPLTFTVPSDETRGYGQAETSVLPTSLLDSGHEIQRQSVSGNKIIPTVVFDYSLQFALLAWQQQYQLNAWLTMSQIDKLQLKLRAPTAQNNFTQPIVPSVQIRYNNKIRTDYYSTVVNVEEIEGFMMPVRDVASNLDTGDTSSILNPSISIVPDLKMLVWIQTSLKEAQIFYREKKDYYASLTGRSHSSFSVNHKGSRNHQYQHHTQQGVPLVHVPIPPTTVSFFEDSTSPPSKQQFNPKVAPMPYPPQSVYPLYHPPPISTVSREDQYMATMPPPPQ